MTSAEQRNRFWLKGKPRRRLIRNVITYLLLIGYATIVIIPFLWMVSTSFKTKGAVFLLPPQWIPHPFHWQNYVKALTMLPFGTFFINSSIITSLSILGRLISCSLVAFGFARIRAPGRDILFIVLLSTLMLPPITIIIPQYLLFNFLGWIDTFKPLIIPNWFGEAFGIFLLRQYFTTIPQELDDAARIDGYGHFGIYWRMILPLSKPALAALIIINFMWRWNDFLQPLLYLNSPDKLTLAVGLKMFQDYVLGVEYHLLMAASVVVMLPPIILFFFTQRFFIQGLATTGIKG